MDARNLGRSGLIVSDLGLGCNNFGMKLDKDASVAVVRACLDSGITMFDTADSYGRGQAEEFLGAALTDHRDDVVIATKFSGRMGDGPYMAGASRKYIVRACEASLRRLHTDYIDLYYQHWYDPGTPVEETLSALDDLVRQGKVRYTASSNFAGWQVADAEHIARARGLNRFIGCQVEWSLLARGAEQDVVPACANFGIGVVPYFPLASGLLTGKYQRGKDFPAGSRLASMPYFSKVASDARFDALETLTAFAAERGHSILELALSWLLGQPSVGCVLVGATTPEQVAANAGAIGWTLTHDDRIAIDQRLSEESK